MSSHKKPSLSAWIGIGLLSILVTIGCYFAAHWVTADVMSFGGGPFGGYAHTSVIYRLENYELGGWAEAFFTPAA